MTELNLARLSDTQPIKKTDNENQRRIEEWVLSVESRLTELERQAAYVKNGFSENLGLSFSSSTLKVVQANGDDLIENSPGYVYIPSNTTGLTTRFKVNSPNHLFVDDTGTSDIVGEEFGTDAGTAWGNARPFFLYAVNSDDTDNGVAFAISPDWDINTTPATTHLGYHGNPASTASDRNFFFLTDTDITTTHDGKPCVCLGFFTMTKSSSDDWSVGSLSDIEGIGVDRLNSAFRVEFSMPLGQMGAESSNLFSAAGGSGEPTWATAGNMDRVYYILPGRKVLINYSTVGAGSCTNGSSSSDLWVHTPYEIDGSIGSYSVGHSYVRMAGVRRSSSVFHINSNQSYFLFNNETAGGFVASNAFSNSLDAITLNVLGFVADT